MNSDYCSSIHREVWRTYQLSWIVWHQNGPAVANLGRRRGYHCGLVSTGWGVCFGTSDSRKKGRSCLAAHLEVWLNGKWMADRHGGKERVSTMEGHSSTSYRCGQGILCWYPCISWLSLLQWGRKVCHNQFTRHSTTWPSVTYRDLRAALKERRSQNDTTMNRNWLPIWVSPRVPRNIQSNGYLNRGSPKGILVLSQE